MEQKKVSTSVVLQTRLSLPSSVCLTLDRNWNLIWAAAVAFFTLAIFRGLFSSLEGSSWIHSWMMTLKLIRFIKLPCKTVPQDYMVSHIVVKMQLPFESMNETAVLLAS